MPPKKADHLKVVTTDTQEKPKVSSIADAAASRIPLKAVLGEYYVVPEDAAAITADLPNKKAGDVPVGHLNTAEIEIYTQLHIANKAKNHFERFGIRNLLHELGDSIAEETEDKLMKKTPRQIMEAKATEEEKMAYFINCNKVEMLKGILWWQVKQRFGLQDFVVGVRKNFEVVRTERRAIHQVGIAD